MANLPPTLPTSHGGNTSFLRPQTTSLPKAKTSTSVFHDGKGYQQHSTSIHHTGEQQTAKTSINDHQGEAKHNIYDSGQSQEARDFSRYAYMRKLIKARKEREAAEVAAQASSGKTFSVATGKAFKKSGAGGFSKQFRSYLRTHKSSIGKLSADQVTAVEGIIANSAQHKHTGSSFSRLDKAKMRKQLRTLSESGTLSRGQVKRLGKFIADF